VPNDNEKILYYLNMSLSDPQDAQLLNKDFSVTKLCSSQTITEIISCAEKQKQKL